MLMTTPPVVSRRALEAEMPPPNPALMTSATTAVVLAPMFSVKCYQRWRWPLPRPHGMGNLAAGQAGHHPPSAKPFVDVLLALDAATAVERVIARERADLVAGLHAILAQGAGVV